MSNNTVTSETPDKRQAEQKTKGLLVWIYRSDLDDCSNDGISSRCTKAILTGPGVSGAHYVQEDTPEVRLEQTRCKTGLKAVPAFKPDGVNGPMAGGCFIYSSDDRFPSRAPIALHDRFEAWGS